MRQVQYINILNQINAGGTATVYFGIDQYTGFPVAVKEPNPVLYKNPLFKELFVREANAYLELQHPNIVKLRDLFLFPEEGYLIMDFVDGKNLREYMKYETGALPFENAAVFMNEVLNAIQFSHDMGYIHMDIKPANVMISTDDEIKVIDFGISVDTSKKFNNDVMGTPYYMSPEQINGRDIDYRTDIYSLGVTLYELVTGRPPFVNPHISREELLDIVKREPIPMVQPNNSIDIPFSKLFNKIIENATAKNPDDRYQSCKDFQKDLMKIFN